MTREMLALHLLPQLLAVYSIFESIERSWGDRVGSADMASLIERRTNARQSHH